MKSEEMNSCNTEYTSAKPTPDSELDQALEQLKRDYRSIPVPPEMKQRILKTFEEAEPNMKNNEAENTSRTANTTAGSTSSGKAQLRRIFPRRAAQTAAAALLAVTVLANSGPQIAFAMEQIPVIGAITKVVTFRTYERNEGRTEAKVEVPQVEVPQGEIPQAERPQEGSSLAGIPQTGASDAVSQLNRSVEEYTSRIISRFEEEVKEAGKEMPHGLFSDYQVLTDNDRFFTLKLQTTEIMASAAQTAKFYTIDKKADKILTLADLFLGDSDYVNRLSDAVKEQMQNNMNADAGLVYFLDDSADGFETIAADQNFYINDKGRLVLVFDEYDVAPGYMGLVEIELPESVFHVD